MKHECDIVLLSYESPDLLKKCVESVLENTLVPSRLIIVDNNSTSPEVREYLDNVSGKWDVEIEKVFSPENAGFAGGINKGLRLSTAPYVCILNNDCEVYSGWLREMINVASIDSSIGLVNPQSNTFGCNDPLLVKDKSGKFVELGHAIGFACLIKREVLETIGLFDEAYEGVCYEDTDFACRAMKKGFISVMACGAYVYHREQASRSRLPGKKEIYKKNKYLFESRWGRLLRMLFVEQDSEDERILKDYKNLKNVARKRIIVDMWVEKKDRGQIIKSLEKKGITEHADVGIKSFPKSIRKREIITKVLTKKKKYDAVITRDPLLYGILRVVSALRGTQTFFLKEDKYLVSGRGEVIDIRDISVITERSRKKK